MEPNLTVRVPDLSTPDLNSAPHDADQLASSSRVLPLYRTPLGDAIFPGDDIYTVRMRSDFSEMLLQHAEEGDALDMTAIAATLAQFTPARVSTATHPTWREREGRMESTRSHAHLPRDGEVLQRRRTGTAHGRNTNILRCPPRCGNSAWEHLIPI